MAVLSKNKGEKSSIFKPCCMNCFRNSFKLIIGKLQLICTALLIFSMGVSLGSRDDFFSDLSQLGLESLIFAVIPGIFSKSATALKECKSASQLDCESYKTSRCESRL